MPRGNDSEAALHELADRFGEGVGNAEDLIDANLAANSQELRAAQLLPRDEEATREAIKNIGKYSGPDGEDVVSIAVRGAPTSPQRYTVIVYRTEEGRDLIAALDEDDRPIVPGHESSKKQRATRRSRRERSADTDAGEGSSSVGEGDSGDST